MATIAVLLTCHNRRETTLVCLEALLATELPGDVSIDVHLVDDGSTDGTAAAVEARFPQVRVHCGSGELYWAGGMRLAWAEASVICYDYYLWLNDDTVLRREAIKALLQVCEQSPVPVIACGSTIDPRDHARWTYGGYDSNRKLILPREAPIECEYFNGNCVLIPHSIFLILGNIEKTYSHALGDFDYGIRAKKRSIRMLVAPGCLGECKSHDRLPRWCRNEGSILERIRALYHPLGCAPLEFFVFDRRQNGFTKACWHFVTLHVRAIMPSLWGDNL